MPCRGPTSPSSSDSTGLFFFRSGLAFRPRSAGTCGGAVGRLEGAYDLVGAFEVDPLPLAAISSFRLLWPLFKAILSSSSSEELFGRAIARIGVRTLEFLSDSPLEFEMLIKGALELFSSSKWNFSISSLAPLMIDEMRQSPL